MVRVEWRRALLVKINFGVAHVVSHWMIDNEFHVTIVANIGSEILSTIIGNKL